SSSAIRATPSSPSAPSRTRGAPASPVATSGSSNSTVVVSNPSSTPPVAAESRSSARLVCSISSDVSASAVTDSTMPSIVDLGGGPGARRWGSEGGRGGERGGGGGGTGAGIFAPGPAFDRGG